MDKMKLMGEIDVERLVGHLDSLCLTGNIPHRNFLSLSIAIREMHDTCESCYLCNQCHDSFCSLTHKIVEILLYAANHIVSSILVEFKLFLKSLSILLSRNFLKLKLLN